jgi:spermidine synthase
MFASGAAGVVWQMVWTAQFGLALGHEIVAVLSVMAAFFGGIAAGALLLADRIERSAHPGRWYAGLEVLIAGWALLVALVTPLLLPFLSGWIGAEPSALWHWTLAFFVPLIFLLPATLAMGATLPAMERQLRQQQDQPLELVYAANTAGAMAGLLLAVFFFIPALGLLETSLVFAAVNLGCGLLAWQVWGRSKGQLLSDAVHVAAYPAAPPVTTTSGPTRFGLTAASRPVALRLFFTGLLGIGYEVLAVRVLSQVTENTVYTYAILLAVFLLATAVGAASVRRYGTSVAQSVAQSLEQSAAQVDRAVGRLAVAIVISGFVLWWADRVYAFPALWLKPGPFAAICGEWLAGMAAMLLPAMAMGALFTLLSLQAQQLRMPLGRAVGINAAGAALAPLLIGLVLLSNLNAKLVLILLLAGYLALRTLASWTQASGWLVTAAACAIAAFAPPLRFVDIPPQGRLISYHEGVMAAVSVVEDADGVARLHINNRVQEGSSASGLVETRLAQLPLLLHPAPRKALFLGLGTGYTANAAALDAQVEVEAVELLPEVIQASGIFALRPGAPASARPVKTVAADARRYVQSSPARHDVIVADLFHPARSGAGSLYTVEHFSAVRASLQPGGLFCQWLALHQMDEGTLRSIVAAFLQVYPQAVAVLASNSLDTPVIGLIARPDETAWRVDDVRARLAAAPPQVTAALKLAHLEDEFAVLGSVVAGPQALKAFAAGAPVNTDDHPVVAHRAPWTSYFAESRPRDRLAALMQSVAPRLEGVVSNSRNADAARLAAYWSAREKYLKFGMAVRPDADPQVMLERLREPLLAIVAISADFRPASEPLMALSKAVRFSNPELSAQVDADLKRVLLTSH